MFKTLVFPFPGQLFPAPGSSGNKLGATHFPGPQTVISICLCLYFFPFFGFLLYCLWIGRPWRIPVFQIIHHLGGTNGWSNLFSSCFLLDLLKRWPSKTYVGCSEVGWLVPAYCMLGRTQLFHEAGSFLFLVLYEISCVLAPSSSWFKSYLVEHPTRFLWGVYGRQFLKCVCQIMPLVYLYSQLIWLMRCLGGKY